MGELFHFKNFMYFTMHLPMQIWSTSYAQQMKQSGMEKNHTLCWEQC